MNTNQGKVDTNGRVYANPSDCRCGLAGGAYSGLPGHYVLRDPAHTSIGLPVCFQAYDWRFCATNDPYLGVHMLASVYKCVAAVTWPVPQTNVADKPVVVNG